LRSSFCRISASGSMRSTPRRSRASCSSTDFTGGLRAKFKPNRPRMARKTRIRKGSSADMPQRAFWRPCPDPCDPCNPWLALFLVVHLKPAGGLEGVTVVNDVWFALICGPTQGQDIEACRAVQQAAFLQVVQRQIGKPPLFG